MEIERNINKKQILSTDIGGMLILYNILFYIGVHSLIFKQFTFIHQYNTLEGNTVIFFGIFSLLWGIYCLYQYLKKRWHIFKLIFHSTGYLNVSYLLWILYILLDIMPISKVIKIFTAIILLVLSYIFISKYDNKFRRQS